MPTKKKLKPCRRRSVRAWLLPMMAIGILSQGFLSGQESAGKASPRPEEAEEPTVEEIRSAAEAKAGAEQAAEEAAGENEGLNLVVAKMVPEGEPSKNVAIPSFKEGVLNSLVKAESITRVDDENLESLGMQIELFNAKGELDVTIKMKTSGYHMPSGLLESDSRTFVEGQDFEMSGDRLIYDTRTQQGKLLGNVKMYVYSEAQPEDSKSK